MRKQPPSLMGIVHCSSPLTWTPQVGEGRPPLLSWTHCLTHSSGSRKFLPLGVNLMGTGIAPGVFKCYFEASY